MSFKFLFPFKTKLFTLDKILVLSKKTYFKFNDPNTIEKRSVSETKLINNGNFFLRNILTNYVTIIIISRGLKCVSPLTPPHLLFNLNQIKTPKHL